MRYQFEGIVQGKYLKVKMFNTREKANKYLAKVLDTYNLEVTDIFNRNDNIHNVEYVCDNYNMFFIDRI